MRARRPVKRHKRACRYIQFEFLTSLCLYILLGEAEDSTKSTLCSIMLFNNGQCRIRKFKTQQCLKTDSELETVRVSKYLLNWLESLSFSAFSALCELWNVGTVKFLMILIALHWLVLVRILIIGRSIVVGVTGFKFTISMRSLIPLIR